jgi:integrase
LLIRIRLANSKWRYAKAAYTANRRLRPMYALVKGAPEHHPEGTYVLRFKGSDGKAAWETIGTDPDAAVTAKLRRDSLLKTDALGLTVAATRRTPVPVTPTLAERASEYLAYVEGRIRSRTHVAYSKAVSLFLESCQVKRVEDLTSKDIDAFVTQMRQNGNSPRTASNRVTALRTFLRWAGKPEVITGRELPRYTDKIVAAYSRADIETLIRAAQAEERLIWRFFLGSGCREQEAMYATWPDVDFEAGLLYVREKPLLGFFIKDGEERAVPLPDDLIDALKRRREFRSNDLFLFPTNAGKPDGHFLRRLKRTAFRGGLNCGHCLNKKGQSCAEHPVCRKWELHKFRRSFATMHHEAGVSSRTLMKWLGHSDFATTLRYLEAADVRSERVRGLVNKTFGAFDFRAA